MAPGLKYGFIAATGMSLWMLGEYALGLHTIRIGIGHYTSWGTEVILVLALWCLLRHQLHGPAVPGCRCGKGFCMAPSPASWLPWDSIFFSPST